MSAFVLFLTGCLFLGCYLTLGFLKLYPHHHTFNMGFLTWIVWGLLGIHFIFILYMVDMHIRFNLGNYPKQFIWELDLFLIPQFIIWFICLGFTADKLFKR